MKPDNYAPFPNLSPSLSLCLNRNLNLNLNIYQMATNLVPFRSIGVIASATGDRRKPDTRRRTNSSSSWWTPLFGWSSEPDYIDSNNKAEDLPAKVESNSDSDREPKPIKSRFAPGCFTEEKARQLRMSTAADTSSFHDVMYHSAIACRLASDFSNWSDR
ncbi:unnamed protein product [Camellia sinensis]